MDYLADVKKKVSFSTAIGNVKRETRVRVLCPTLVHGTAKHEMRQSEKDN